MNHPLPKEKITELNYTRTIEGFKVDYVITATLFGEVLAVKSTFLDLPPTAQRLMAGGKYEQISSAAKAFAAIFPYALPLVALDYLDTEEWAQIQEQLSAFKKKVQGPKPYPKYLQQAWVAEAYQKDRDGDLILQHIANLLTEEDQERYNALQFYNKTPYRSKEICDFFGPVILQLLPISSKEQSKKAIYQALATYPTDAVYLLLSSRLNDPDYKHAHVAILKGLKPFQKASHKEVLTKFYKDNPLLGGEKLRLFMESALALPTKEKEVLLYDTILTSNNRQAAGQAYDHLKVNGMTDTILAKRLYPVFKEQRSLENMRAILKLYSQIKDPNFLPSGQDLLTMLEWANTSKIAIAINLSITPLLEKRLDKKDFIDLTNLLKKDSSTIREGAIRQVTALAKPEHINILDKINAEVDKSIQPRITYAVKKLLDTYSANNQLQPLLDLLRDTKTLKIEALMPIKKLLRYTHNPIAIEPLLQELSNSDPKVRRNVLIALRVFKDLKVFTAIEKVAKQDDNAIVRKTAQKCLAWISNPLSESRKLEKERKEKIEDYLEEIITNNEAETGKPMNGVSRFVMKVFGRTYYNYFPKEEWKE